MVVQIPVNSPLPDQVVKEIVQGALRNEAQLAQFRHDQFARECEAFEARFRMTTKEFLAKFEAGELGDAEEYFDWFAAARGREVWEQKASVLGEVAA